MQSTDKQNIAYYAVTLEEVINQLNSNAENGLNADEAKKRLEKYGRNTITEKVVVTPLQILINQLKSPIVYLLLVAATMSFWFKEWLDASAILTVLLINSFIGFYMEYKAQQSMLALKKLSSIPAKVFRGGTLYEINSEEVVPGDIVFVDSGDLVCSDGRIIKSSQLLVDESTLTGESVPVEKNPGVLPENTILADRINSLFKGTYISKGNAYLLVCNTGMQTELGTIANLVHSSDQSATPLEKKLEEFSKKLIIITVGLVVVIFISGLINGQNIWQMLKTAIALAVAAIPEGLPIVATMSLAQGMLKMAKYKVIVKKLSAVETLGGTNVICTDKTGTLTTNKMEVVLVETPTVLWKNGEQFFNEQSFDLLVKCAVLCNTADIQHIGNETKEIGDPLEVALLHFSENTDSDIYTLRKKYLKANEEPFSSETKLMATLHESDGKYYVFAKGAAEELLLKCTYIYYAQKMLLDEGTRQNWLLKSQEYAAAGHRIIAVAYNESATVPNSLTDKLVFLGLIGMIDPPRSEVLSAINDCKTAGIKVVMVTGDHPSTAQFIGSQLGISSKDEKPVIGKNMKEYNELSDEEKLRWTNTSIFARVDPKHKLDLVKVFQEKGFVVGMTGDGVNDAPALQKADIGIAMGLKGTQVAQEVADMVLQDDSFSSIVIAIRQGRIIFDNIRKFVTFLLSCNLSEILVIAVAAILNLHFQLIPLQILFMNLITDVLPALALGVTEGNDNIMHNPPRNSSEPIINNKRWKLIFLYSLIIASASLGAVLFYHYFFHADEIWDAKMCNNILFFTLILSQLFHVFNMGNGPFFKSEVIKNKYVWLATLISIVILFIILQIPVALQALNIIPMTLYEWIIILAASLSSVLVIQIFKQFKSFK